MTVSPEMIEAGKACFVAALDDPQHAGDGRVFAQAYDAMKALDPDLRKQRWPDVRREEADKLLPYFTDDWEPLRCIAARSGTGKSASQLASRARDLLSQGLIEARWLGSSMCEYRIRDVGGDRESPDELADTVEELVGVLRKCPHARECGVHSSLGICDCGRSAVLAKIGGDA